MKKAKIACMFALSVMLSACVGEKATVDNTKVADFYEKNGQSVVKNLSEADKELVQKYMALKTATVKRFVNGEVILDTSEGDVSLNKILEGFEGKIDFKKGSVKVESNNIVVDNGFVVMNNDTTTVYALGGDNNRVVLLSVHPGSEKAKALLGDVTFSQAIKAQKEYDERMSKKLEDEIALAEKMKVVNRGLRGMLLEKENLSESAVNLYMSFFNNGTKPVEAFRGIINIIEIETGRKITSFTIDYNEGPSIPVREFGYFDGDLPVDLNIMNEKLLHYMKDDDLDIRLNVTDILYGDGTTEGTGLQDFEAIHAELIEKLKAKHKKELEIKENVNDMKSTNEAIEAALPPKVEKVIKGMVEVQSGK